MEQHHLRSGRGQLEQAGGLAARLAGKRLLAVGAHADQHILKPRLRQGLGQALAAPREGQDPDRPASPHDAQGT
eukprot:2028139-Alexandrium_andersonii.AAC.1